MSELPRMSFGIIVLNGEPFTRYCLRSLYPFAHEIIVVEGGHEDARAVTTPDGHSIDGTLETLHRFVSEEDPEKKVRVVTRDGFWPKFDELGHVRTAQSRAYAELATGDYLWQVDIDEFYRPRDMTAVLDRLRSEPSPSEVSFRPLDFFGDINYRIDGWFFTRTSCDNVHRVFKWGPGYKYVTHQPPTIHDSSGRDVSSVRPLTGDSLAARDIYLFHYGHLFPWQVRQKAIIYQTEWPEWLGQTVQWAEQSYFRLDRPYHVERHYEFASWLERYAGDHPPEVLRMMDDARAGRIHVELRETQDIERLLNSWWYPLGARMLQAVDPIENTYRRAKDRLKRECDRIRRVGIPGRGARGR